MFFTRTTRTLDRRSFLRGAGAVLGLPLLEAMRPTFAAAPAAKPVRRLVAIQTNMGILPQHFFPEQPGRDFPLPPYLKLLEDVRDRFTVFSGVSHPDVDGAHEAEKSFLSAAPHPGSAAFKSTISLDQFAAEQFGPVTRFSSFVLGVNAEATQGMSFNRAGVKIPPERSPAAVYRRMFLQGKPDEVAARIEELRQGRSLLDFLAGNAQRLKQTLGAADRERMEQYAAAVRDLEKQLEQAQAWERKPKPKTTTPMPTDVPQPSKLLERIQLMLDMTRLALESDSTRVVSLFINTFSIVPELPGVSQETHSITHHGGRPEALEQLFKIESAQLKALNGFLTRLKVTPEAGSHLLDRTIVLYGAPMGNANSHANTNLPILLAGGGFRHAGHLAFDQKKNYPLPNLFVSLLQQLGLPVDKFASSTGTMRGLEPTG